MLHKAATSFSPFKLQHLHHHIRSALNLNLGSNASSNWQQAASNGGSSAASAGPSTSSSAGAGGSLGSAAGQAGGSGSAKWHAGRSHYYQYSHGRTQTPAPNATSSTDGSTPSKLLDDEDELIRLRNVERALQWRSGRKFAGRQRSSSVSNPGLTTGTPVVASPATATAASLPRSSPYSFTQTQLQARYRHAFSQARRPHVSTQAQTAAAQHAQPSQQEQAHGQTQPRLLTLSPQQQTSPFSTTSFSGKPASHAPSAPSSIDAATSIPRRERAAFPASAPSSPRLAATRVPYRRNSTSAIASSSTDIPPLDNVVPKPEQLAGEQEQPAAIESEQAAQGIASGAEETSDKTAADDHSHAIGWPAFDTAAPADTARDPLLNTLDQLRYRQEVSQIRSIVRAYRASSVAYSAKRHAKFIHVLNELRAFSDVSKELLELWDDHFDHDMVPRLSSYSIVINTLALRSLDTDRILRGQQLQNNAARLAQAAQAWSRGEKHTSAGSAEGEAASEMHSEASLAALRQQSDADYQSARSILHTLGREGQEIPAPSLDAVLAAAAARGDVDTALRAFGFLEGSRSEPSRASAASFKHLLLTYAKAGEPAGVATVFDGFLKGIGKRLVKERKRAEERVQALDLLQSESADADARRAAEEIVAAVPAQALQGKAKEDDVLVWDAMVYALVAGSDAPAGLDLLEKMMASKDAAATPPPTAATLLGLVQAFTETGDLASAFRWADKIHTVPTPADLPTPSPRLEETFNTIIAALSSKHSEGTTLEVKVQEATASTSLLEQLGKHVRRLAGIVDEQHEAPTSPASSGGSSYDLSSVFSDPQIRSRTMSITPPPTLSSIAPESKAVKIDLVLSAKVDDMVKSGMSPLAIYGIVKSARRDDVHAHPEALARLVQRLATVQATKELEDTYLIAYNTLASLPAASEQTAAWAYLEDRMLIAMANAGDLGKAALHRDRLLQAGAAPSADSYAAMITSAKDTTDDATVALELFEEARRFSVVPNLYLFNILISKLSKARRTHLALSYFEQMKTVGIRPSAVTYGSVIAACCRTGDEKAATFLFNEMVRSPGYRPRVPPYNTMMQFYISSQPDREKALSYFDAMLRARIAPTAHTYKLLLDAYGTLEPVDMSSVEDVFGRLVNDNKVPVTGVHWSSLINAHAVAGRNLKRAMQVFDSIATHPSTAVARNNGTAMPDAICYETMINVLLANERPDLVEQYLHRMQSEHVRPTAYIYNSLIRAHAAMGDIKQAREVFESLSDPQSGVAATGNHALEGAAAEHAPVHREPSTFETMIRCELRLSEQGRAEALLARAVQRAFPSAVLAKLEKLTMGEESAPQAAESAFPLSP